MSEEGERLNEIVDQKRLENIAYHCSHHIRGPLVALQSLVTHVDQSTLTNENKELMKLIMVTCESLQRGIDRMCVEIYMIRDSKVRDII
jgi:light-regulated signal transduction histidine kinase (bacteriophytochrome)